MTRPLEELLSDEDAWPEIQKWAAASTSDVQIVEAEREDGERALLELQVTTRSPLGAVALHAAGIRVDHGWVRVLGAGGHGIAVSLLDPVPGSAAEPLALEAGLIVATDAIGGFFALNGGGLPGASGEVVYLAPDTLSWEPQGGGHEAWLRWLFDADLEGFYEGSRWPGWEKEVEDLPADRGIHTHPPLFTREGKDIASAHRRPIPIGELWGVWHDFRDQAAIADR